MSVQSVALRIRPPRPGAALARMAQHQWGADRLRVELCVCSVFAMPAKKTPTRGGIKAASRVRPGLSNATLAHRFPLIHSGVACREWVAKRLLAAHLVPSPQLPGARDKKKTRAKSLARVPEG